jgi:hypothetical protein
MTKTKKEQEVVDATKAQLADAKAKYDALVAEDEAWKKQYNPKQTPEYQGLESRKKQIESARTILSNRLDNLICHVKGKYLDVADHHLRYAKPEYTKAQSWDRKSNIRHNVLCAIQRELKISYLRESDVNTIVQKLMDTEMADNARLVSTRKDYQEVSRDYDKVQNALWKLERDIPKSPVQAERFYMWRVVGELESRLSNPAKTLQRSREAVERDKAEDDLTIDIIYKDLKDTEKARAKRDQESECAAEAAAESRMFERPE